MTQIPLLRHSLHLTNVHERYTAMATAFVSHLFHDPIHLGFTNLIRQQRRPQLSGSQPNEQEHEFNSSINKKHNHFNHLNSLTLRFNGLVDDKTNDHHPYMMSATVNIWPFYTSNPTIQNLVDHRGPKNPLLTLAGLNCLDEEKKVRRKVK